MNGEEKREESSSDLSPFPASSSFSSDSKFKIQNSKFSSHPPLLKATNISHSFDYPLFEEISISLHKKESVAITGVSGSGKSTLLHIFSTLLRPDRGSVKLFDQDIYSLNDADILKIRRYQIGIIFQSHYLFKGFSARENIELSSVIANQKKDEQMIERLKIDNILDQNVGELSGGQQQRVSIARVLAKKPKIIFADEPTGNLDKDTASDVMNSIFLYLNREEGALFLVTHDMALAEKCDKIYKLDNGRLVKTKNV